MQHYPSLNTQVIGQAERTMDGLLTPILERTDTTLDQWLVLTVTAANGGTINEEQLVGRIAGARKLEVGDVRHAIASLKEGDLLRPSEDVEGVIALSQAGHARYLAIRTPVDEIVGRLFGDLPEADLATAGRILTILTERANEELARL